MVWLKGKMIAWLRRCRMTETQREVKGMARMSARARVMRTVR